MIQHSVFLYALDKLILLTQQDTHDTHAQCF